MEKEQAPEILENIVAFLNFWNNPDNSEEEYVPIKAFQLEVYSVSYAFAFKWYITQEELQQVSDYTDIEIEGNCLKLGIGEYQVELEAENPKTL